jgi:peroxiredoxin
MAKKKTHKGIEKHQPGSKMPTVAIALGLGAALLVIGALGLTIFKGNSTDGPAVERSQPEARADLASIPVGTGIGQRAPEFTLADLSGETVRLSGLRGRPTVVYFSAAWCTSCVPQTKELAKLQAEYRDRMNVVWIDVNPGQDTVEDLREYMTKYGHEDFIAAFDTLSSEVSRTYQVKALGETYLLDEQGIIVQSGVGVVFSERFRRALQDLVAQASSAE